jgi:hypothetical protein
MPKVFVVPATLTGPPSRLAQRDEALTVDLHYSDSQSKHFGPDEQADADIPYSIQWDTQMPGGFGSGSLVLPRPPKLRADDAALFSDVTISGPGVRTAYEGRVTGVPQVGSEEIRLDLEGWSAELEDDETFRQVFVDRDFSHWGEWTVNRRTALATPGTPMGKIQSQVDTGGIVFDAPNEDLAQFETTEVWYAGTSGLPISGAYYRGSRTSLTSFQAAALYAGANADSTNESYALTLDDTLRAVSLNPVRPSLMVRLTADPGVTPPAGAQQRYTVLTVYGNHGLPTRPIFGEPDGMYGSDVIGYVLNGTSLNYTLGDSIEQSGYAIPHLVFLEPVTRRTVVEQVTALGGAQLVPNDWGVYAGREFFWKTPGTYGKTWRVRRDQVAEPTGDGPDSKARTSAFMISYSDGSGKTHSVGFPGSGADYETTDLLDTDSSNPANRLRGKRRHEQVGITNQEGALNIGRLLLAEANRIDWRGSTTIRGEATDDAGNKYPAREIKSGDQIVVEDDEGLWEPRPISHTSYQHSDLAVTVDIGATPHRGEVLLAQLVVATGLVAS